MSDYNWPVSHETHETADSIFDAMIAANYGSDGTSARMTQELFHPDNRDWSLTADSIFDAMIAANYGSDGTSARMTRELFGPDDPNDGIYGSGRIIPFTSPGGGILCCDGRQLVGV